MKKIKHAHYEFHAYDSIDDKFVMQNVSLVAVLANNEGEALIKVKQLLARPGYRVNKVWECLDRHGVMDEVLKGQRQLVEYVKEQRHG